MDPSSAPQPSAAKMLVSLIFAGLLVLLGLALLGRHARVWRLVRERETDERELAFARRQFRRRRRTSAIIVVLGLAVAGGELIRSPVVGLVYWLSILLLLVWILALAALDALASQQHFGAQRAVRDAEEAILLRQLRGDVESRHNGSGGTDGRVKGEE